MSAARPEMTSADIQALNLLKPIQLELDAGAAFELMAVIQLASRHPAASQTGPIRRCCSLARELQKHLSATKNLAALCEAGWDPTSDVQRTARIILPGG
jgi:hypothetical protein